jgi:xylan 1,4-beta-xylosidase
VRVTILGMLRAAVLGFLAIASTGLQAQAGALSPVTIAVRAGERTGKYSPDWNFFGADEPNYTYAANGKKLLRELHDLSPVPVYFRPHNLLTTGDGDGSLKWGSTNAYREDANGKAIYDWAITDRIFDAMRDAGVRPLVEVGFMPEAMSTHPEPYRHDFPKGDVFTGWSYPPKDYDKWGALVEAYATHLKARYGAGTDTWLWEVWNEPDIDYWHGTPEEYDRLYDVTTAAIRRVIPGAKVGGPSATGIHAGRSEHMLRQFLEHCESGKNAATGGVGAPLDFISYHPKGSPKVVEGHVQMGLGEQLGSVERGMKVIASYPRWKSTPIIMTEIDPEGCAACKGAQNGYRNGPLYGVSVAEAMARSYELARTYGVNLQGGVTWAFEFEDQPYFAGFRELATNGIDKAVLNVFRMYGKMGGDWVKTESSGEMTAEEIIRDGVRARDDVGAIATRGEHEVDVMVWNYSDEDVAAGAKEIAMKVDGLPKASVRVEEFRMDEGHSNAYGVWKGMGSPEKLTEGQRTELEKVSGLARMGMVRDAVVKDGKVDLRMALPRSGVGWCGFGGRGWTWFVLLHECPSSRQ